MAKAAALVITGISIALLVIYGADAAVGAGNPDHEGFLDMDHMTRGLGLGGMILITGILIIIGAVTVIGMADPSEAEETTTNPLMETAPLLIVGGIQMGLGVLKIKKS